MTSFGRVNALVQIRPSRQQNDTHIVQASCDSNAQQRVSKVMISGVPQSPDKTRDWLMKIEYLVTVINQTKRQDCQV